MIELSLGDLLYDVADQLQRLKHSFNQLHFELQRVLLRLDDVFLHLLQSIDDQIQLLINSTLLLIELARPELVVLCEQLLK